MPIWIIGKFYVSLRETFPMNSILSDKTAFEKAFREAKNSSHLLELLGLHPGSGNYVTLRKYAKLYGLTLPKSGTRKAKSTLKTEHFCVDSTVARHHIKAKIIQHNLLPYICCKCGLEDRWNGFKLSLQLEHKNGINNDNRLENLAFICPNCHSQTATYAGKNKKSR